MRTVAGLSRFILLSWILACIPTAAAEKSVKDMTPEELDTYLHRDQKSGAKSHLDLGSNARSSPDAAHSSDGDILRLVSQLKTLHESQVMPRWTGVSWACDARLMRALRSESDILQRLSVNSGSITQSHTNELVDVLLQILHTADQFLSRPTLLAKFLGNPDSCSSVDQKWNAIAENLSSEALGVFDRMGTKAVPRLRQYLTEDNFHATLRGEAETALTGLGETGTKVLAEVRKERSEKLRMEKEQYERRPEVATEKVMNAAAECMAAEGAMSLHADVLREEYQQTLTMPSRERIQEVSLEHQRIGNEAANKCRNFTSALHQFDSYGLSRSYLAQYCHAHYRQICDGFLRWFTSHR